MKKLTLSHCWLSTKSYNPLILTAKVPRKEQQKLLQWVPFEYAGHVDAEAGTVDVVTLGIPREDGEPFILKKGGAKAEYSTRDSKGRRHPLGAVMNQYYQVVLCLLPGGTIGLYSVEFELDPPLNKFGQVHVEPTRRSRAAVEPITNLDEEQEEEYV
jgi:hypothetical protein